VDEGEIITAQSAACHTVVTVQDGPVKSKPFVPTVIIVLKISIKFGT